MQSIWQGYYLDGQSAGRQPASIHLLRDGLQVTTASGLVRRWFYRELRQTQGAYNGEQVRLEHGGEFPEVLVVSEPDFLSTLYQVAPKMTSHFHNPARRRKRILLTLSAALAAVGMITVLYVWGIPALVDFVTARVPVSWEERLGQEVVNNLAPQELRCLDPTRTAKIESILAILTATLENQPYTFRVTVVNKPMINAFAAPGGSIVLFRGLLEHTHSPEELAGVLAHEVQHIIQRHATRALLQHTSTGVLLAALSGDTSGGISYGLESARIIGMLQYSRRHEEEADAAGMRMLLDAGIDPTGMISVYTMLQEETAEVPEVLQYVSTHPNTADRIERLQALAKTAPHSPVKLMQTYDWHDMHKMCLDTE
jgi:predicted Zn-dependent protease